MNNVIDNYDDLNASWGSDKFREAAKEEVEYGLIPNEAKAPAQILDIKMDAYDGQPNINVTYKLTGGAYKNRQIFQSLAIFNRDERGEKGRLKLGKLYTACGVEMPTGLPTTDNALSSFIGKEVGVCVSLYNEKNYIFWFCKLTDKFIIDDKKDAGEWKTTPPLNSNTPPPIGSATPPEMSPAAAAMHAELGMAEDVPGF